MGLIKLDDKTFPDRRTNGARIKLDWGDWIKVASVIVILILAGGKIQWTVNNHSEAIAEQKSQIKINTTRLDRTETDITNIKENLIYIRGKIDTLILNMK